MEVSCVIPSVSEYEYIEDSVMSMVEQTVEPLEVVVVNSGGHQKTIESIPDHNLVKVVTINSLVCSSRARNAGVEHSSGDLVCFLDADDISKEDRIDKQLQYFPEHDVTAQCAHTVEKINSRGEVKRPHIPLEPYSLDEIKSRSVAYSSSIMCKREVAFWDESYKTAEDFKFMVDRLLDGSEINLSNNDVFSYRDRGGSKTDGYDRKSSVERIKSRLSQ